MTTSDVPPAPLEMQAITMPSVLRLESVDGPAWCYVNRVDVPAGCAFEAPDPDGEVTEQIFVARYPPAFYALAGLPTLLESVGVDSGRRCTSGRASSPRSPARRCWRRPSHRPVR